MAKVTEANYAAKLKAAILNAAITGKLTGGTSDWKTVKLGDVCETCLDGDWIESKDQAPSGIRLIQTGNIGFGVYEDKGERAKYISEETFERLNCTEIFPGDVLISRLPSPVGRACILPQTNSRMITAVDCTIIRPKETILPKYLVFYASSQIYFDLINEKVTGTTRPRISRKNLESIYLPLPPLAIQREIVGKVEKLMGLVEIVQEGGAKIRELGEKARAKILDLAIHGALVAQDPAEPPAAVAASVTTPPYALPPNWKWVKLGEVFAHNTGKALNRANSEGEMLTYITTSNVYWEGFKLDNLRQMHFTKAEVEKCTVQKGDLLVCEGGDIGRAAIWNYDYPMRIQNHIHRLRPKMPVCVKFYYYVLQYMKMNNQIGGKGIGIQGLPSRALDNIIFPLPPLAEQKRIVGKVEAMMNALEGLGAGF